MNLTKQTILLTGGTGSFGKAFIAHLLSQKTFKGVIRIYSRDEFKQHALMAKYQGDKRLRFLLGDVRDLRRLKRAIVGVDYVIHAAALKQVPLLEYNPFEAIHTNIMGSENVIEASLDENVSKVILISSDKAVSPVNLYGATKMVAEKIFIQANSYGGEKSTKFSVVRYGNVMGSRGSVVPVFISQAKNNHITITDIRMTRFWITLEQGVELVINTLGKMKGGEIFVPKIPSVRITEVAKAISPNSKIRIVGIRPGEKLHEALISFDESRHTREFKNYFLIEPEFDWWAGSSKVKKKPVDGFMYSSDNNNKWLSAEKIKTLISDIASDGAGY
ncbi:MAG: UDP-N-acetylglucosamine 4,6-dehydratase (inverting) [Candidatus Curtissbacteria bacterium]|nr:UDP-N-acetylglucosamine 4,6-dehydratase (inverting) [Candidatus Curtissbacteria bacterium]